MTNDKNLITGTRYMNVEGMLPFENMVAEYIKETRNHVLYRVTPIFKGDNLVASGVQIEAESVEDKGYVYFDWNVDSTDASDKKVSKEQIVNNVLKYANGKDKICVLMHDLTGKTTTADALPEILAGLKEMGYRFEGLNENSPIFHQAVAN